MSTSHESPVKQIRSMGSTVGAADQGSPFMHWAASPLYQFDCFSPDASNMSFTMTSPPCQFKSYDPETTHQSDQITSAISPSIFSPKDRPAMKHPKKRELYESSNSVRSGIINTGDKVSPESRSESRNSMDLPHASSILDSPHFSLWASVQNAMTKNGNDLFAPPTPASMNGSSSSKSSDGHARHWSQGIAGEADVDIFTATSHVMRMSASPLISSESYLLDSSNIGNNKMNLKFKKSSDADYNMDVEDSNESYELETAQIKKETTKRGQSQSQGEQYAPHSTGKSSTSNRKKKPFVSPDNSVESSVGLHGLGSSGGLQSPQDGSSSVEKLSVAVKNQKFGVSSMVKPTMNSSSSSSSAGNRRLIKPQHSVLEKSDLSQYFGTRHGDESVGDDSNNSGKATVAASALASSSVEVTVCNCKKSKCLKLYCDCFAVMNYCSGGCNCYDCCNTTERESIRLEAIKTTKERNASAFQTKINERDQHSTGCHCKNSQCLKKYCECFTNAAFCGQNCKCLSCLNYSGSVDLVKARTSAKDGEGPGSSRKRKESPSSVAFLDGTPPADPLKVLQPPKLGTQLHLSPDPVGLAKAQNNGSGGRLGGTSQRVSAMVATPITGLSAVLMDRPRGHSGSGQSMPQYVPPPHGSGAGSNNGGHGNNADMQQPGSKRAKNQPVAPVHCTPVDATLAGRQLRSRGRAAHEDDTAPPSASVSSVKLQFQSAPPNPSAPPTVQAVKTQPTPAAKKRQVKFAPVVYEYPFFGAQLPKTSKIIALKCLDFLEGKDIYAMSQVNSLWNSAAMDDALWE